MANPSKQKGTGYETRLLAKLQQIWPELSRSSASTASNDFHGAPFGVPVEAKKRSTWAIPEWVRRLRRVADGDVWVLFVEDGDCRRVGSPGEIMVVDADFGRRLLGLWTESLKVAV